MSGVSRKVLSGSNIGFKPSLGRYSISGITTNRGMSQFFVDSLFNIYASIRDVESPSTGPQEEEANLTVFDYDANLIFSKNLTYSNTSRIPARISGIEVNDLGEIAICGNDASVGLLDNNGDIIFYYVHSLGRAFEFCVFDSSNNILYWSWDQNDIYLAKLSNTGNVLYEYFYTGYDDAPILSDIDINDNAFILSKTPGSGFGDILNGAKIDNNGNILWQISVEYNTDWQIIGRQQVFDSSGNTIICGYARDINAAKYYPLLLKYDPNGNLIFAREIDFVNSGTASVNANSCDTDINGNIYISVESNLFLYTNTDVIMKFDTNGNLVWAVSTPIERVANIQYSYNESEEEGQLFISGQNSGGTPLAATINEDGTSLNGVNINASEYSISTPPYQFSSSGPLTRGSISYNFNNETELLITDVSVNVSFND